jgi:hypothetical protein
MSVLRSGASYASQGRISVAGHRAEPNEHGGDLCVGDDTVRVAGIIAARWAAVALGGPVSINQPALNTLASERERARERTRASRSQLSFGAVLARARARSVSRGELRRGATYEGVKISFFRSAVDRIVPRRRVRPFCKTRTKRASARGELAAHRSPPSVAANRIVPLCRPFFPTIGRKG